MNRRSFIGTITALAGLALAKIKAPAAPISGMVKLSGDTLYMTDNAMYLNGVRVVTKDGQTLPFKMNHAQRLIMAKYQLLEKGGQ